MSVNALDLQDEERGQQSMREVTQLKAKPAPKLTARHYAYEGDVDSDPGIIIFALKPMQGETYRFLNGDGKITHTIPVEGKDRWERRRNISSVIQAEAAKHGLGASAVQLDFDGIYMNRWDLYWIVKPRVVRKTTFRSRFDRTW